MAYTEKDIIRIINNLQKLSDKKSTFNPYMGYVLLINDTLYATDAYIIHKITFRDIPQLIVEKKNHFYRVYIDENGKIEITDVDWKIDAMNVEPKVKLETLNSMFDFSIIEDQSPVNPAYLKRALELFKVAKLKSVKVSNIEKSRMFITGFNEFLQANTVVMGLRE